MVICSNLLSPIAVEWTKSSMKSYSALLYMYCDQSLPYFPYSIGSFCIGSIGICEELIRIQHRTSRLQSEDLQWNWTLEQPRIKLRIDVIDHEVFLGTVQKLGLMRSNTDQVWNTCLSHKTAFAILSKAPFLYQNMASCSDTDYSRKEDWCCIHVQVSCKGFGYSSKEVALLDVK